MSDLVVVQPPQDLVIAVQPIPSITPEPDDLLVEIPTADFVINVPVDDMIVVTRAQDLEIVAELPDWEVRMTDIGPMGQRGAAADEPVVDMTSLVAIGGQRVVRAIGGNLVDYASSDVAEHGDQILGITQNAANPGDTIHVQTGGVMDEVGWNWTVGPVYCGLNGVLTQVVPDVGFMCRIGKAIKPTSILINVEEAIILA